jgi:(1->4)-alpha-D-glucan 1-alpha-D-glucosylmutase
VASLAAPFKVEIDGRPAPDRNEEVLLYQTILGTLPFTALAPGAPPALSDEYVERVVRYMQKATKEAKVNTSWIDASPAYDEAVNAFVRGALSAEPLLAMQSLARVVAYHGMWGALAQAVLKFASPGVPDTYQGTELWDDSLVDPDNRRPVDYALRARLLAELDARGHDRLALARELVGSAEDGRIKLYVTARALRSRGELPGVFGAESEYEPLAPSGPAAAHAVAFARRHGGDEIAVVVPRLTAKLMGGALERPTGGAWAGTEVSLRPGRYEDAFTGVVHDARGGAVSLASLFEDFPVAWLVRLGDSA